MTPIGPCAATLLGGVMEETHPGCLVGNARGAGEKEMGSNTNSCSSFVKIQENVMFSANFFLSALGPRVGSPRRLWEGCSDLCVTRVEAQSTECGFIY